MEEQLQLIFPMARKYDPATSKIAGIGAGRRGPAHKAILLEAYQQAGAQGLTDEEAGRITGLNLKPGCCYWKRCSELRKLGLIRPNGETRISLAGEQQQVCVVVEAG